MSNIKKVKHSFDFKPNRNGGETILLTTTLYSDEVAKGEFNPKGHYIDQQMALHCYGQYATINTDVFTPTKLRQLADELEEFLAEHDAKDLV